MVLSTYDPVIAKTPVVVGNAAIKTYIYTQIRNLPEIFDFNYHVGWRIDERVRLVDEIKHPAVKKIIRTFCPEKRLCIIIGGDVPSNIGLDTKSAFVVSFLHSLRCLYGNNITKQDLYDLSYFVQKDILKEEINEEVLRACVFGCDPYVQLKKIPNQEKIIFDLDFQGSTIFTLQPKM